MGVKIFLIPIFFSPLNEYSILPSFFIKSHGQFVPLIPSSETRNILFSADRFRNIFMMPFLRPKKYHIFFQKMENSPYLLLNTTPVTWKWS